MPQSAWSPKRERQYEHVKESLEDRGTNEKKAEEVAARTVNKERARHGETKEASRTSIEDISSGRRGGLRSHHAPRGRTYDQLRNEAPGGRGDGPPAMQALGGRGQRQQAGGRNKEERDSNRQRSRSAAAGRPHNRPRDGMVRSSRSPGEEQPG